VRRSDSRITGTPAHRCSTPHVGGSATGWWCPTTLSRAGPIRILGSHRRAESLRRWSRSRRSVRPAAPASKGRPLVPQATNNQRRSYADRLHNIRQLNRSSQSVLAARERSEIDWLISALAHHRHPAGRADGIGRL